MKRLCLALVFLLLPLAVQAAAPAPAPAKEWKIDYAHSRLGFTGKQGDIAFEGRFARYIASIAFDPAHPEQGKITAAIDMTGATAGSPDRDQMLPQAEWFDAAKFPQARFTSTAIKKTGENAYEADGALALKGIEKKITLPFTLVKEGNHWRADGKVTLVRGDFGIGSGDWADEKVVRAAVEVTVSLSATPPP